MNKVTRLLNCSVATLHSPSLALDYGFIDDAYIDVCNGRIQAVAQRASIQTRADHEIDLHGALVTPGLIDCHTHIVHGGNRANEFEQRLNGVSYADIAKAGGGILSTVKATRTATEAELFASAAQRARALMDDGVTTIEIKSGYGLDKDSELKMLRVARQLGEQLPLSVRNTFLGAHALPPEYAGRADDYINYLCTDVLPFAVAHKLVDAVDVFCENIGFSLAQSEKMLRAAKALGLRVKIHAEQLSDMKGAKKAASLGALSADHLEFLAADDVPFLKQKGTVAVLLPGAFYFLRETKLPPMATLREHGVPIAIASDSNPGSSPVASLLLMLNMACTFFRMTPLEALAGVTINAAKALGLDADRGSIVVGKRADLAVFSVKHPGELSYAIGARVCCGRMVAGEYFAH